MVIPKSALVVALTLGSCGRTGRKTAVTFRVLMVIAAVGWSGSLGAQAPRPWNVAVGIGARTGRPAQDGAAVVGEIGRSVYAASRMTLDLRLTAGHFGTTDSGVCFSKRAWPIVTRGCTHDGYSTVVALKEASL